MPSDRRGHVKIEFISSLPDESRDSLRERIEALAHELAARHLYQYENDRVRVSYEISEDGKVVSGGTCVESGDQAAAMKRLRAFERTMREMGTPEGHIRQVSESARRNAIDFAEAEEAEDPEQTTKAVYERRLRELEQRARELGIELPSPTDEEE